MKIFITGIAGFLGSHLADALLAAGHEVLGVDNLLGGYQDNVPARAAFWKFNCNDLPAMKSLMHGVDVVYHLAAVPHEGLSLFSPAIVAEHTFQSTISTVAAAAHCGVRRFVYASSAARYGHMPTRGSGYRVGTYSWEGARMFDEESVPAPVDLYGIVKLAGERALQCLCGVHEIELVIAVPHNIIGTRQKYDDPYRNVASIMINMMLQNRQPIIFGDGEQTRPFSAVSDCVDSLVQMGVRPGLNGELINIGPDDQSTTVNQLAAKIARVLDFHLVPVYVPERPAEVKHVVVNADKARRLLGYHTQASLDQTLESMIAWISVRGPKPFNYHLPIEINTDKVPAVWRERRF